MIDEKQGEKLRSNVEEVESKFKATANDIMSKLGTFSKELTLISVPKSKKDILINGKRGYVSLIADGRVIIHCNTLDDAQKVYDSFDEIKELKWWQKLSRKWA